MNSVKELQMHYQRQIKIIFLCNQREVLDKGDLFLVYRFFTVVPVKEGRDQNEVLRLHTINNLSFIVFNLLDPHIRAVINDCKY